MTKRISKALMLTVGLLTFSAMSSIATEVRVMTLEQALAIAFEQSPDIKRVALSLESSQQELTAEHAGLKSRFSLTLDPYSNVRTTDFMDRAFQPIITTTSRSSLGFSIVQPIKWTDGTLTITENLSWRRTDASAYDYEQVIDSVTYIVHRARDIEDKYTNDLNISFNQPLFTYNKTKLKIKELELSLENAQLNYTISKLQIETRVTSQFLNLHLSLRSLEIAQVKLANATESHDIIVSKVEAGLTAQEELYQAELTKANALADTQNQQTTYDNSLDNFKIALGLPLEMELFLAADIRKVIIDIDGTKAQEHALLNRLELRQRDIDIQRKLHNIVRTEAFNEFKGSLRLEYGVANRDTLFNNLYSSAEPTRSIGLTINVPLYDWGQKKHLLAADEARLTSTKLDAGELRKSITKDIRAALRELKNYELQIDIAEQNVRNAQLSYDLNLERYRNGDLSSKDIEFYQTQLATEQLNEVRALKDYKLALLDIKILTLWDFENNRSVLTANAGDTK